MSVEETAVVDPAVAKDVESGAALEETVGEAAVEEVGVIILTPQAASESKVNGMFLALQSPLIKPTASGI